MIHRAALLSIFIASLAAPALAQQAGGLTAAETRDWLAAQGGEVGEIQTEAGSPWFEVGDGPVRWTVKLFDCAQDRCASLQFGTAAEGPGATAEAANAWNRDTRFVKAFAAQADGRSVVRAQYDVVLGQGGPDQLADAAVIWTRQVRDFARRMATPPGA